MDTLKCLNCSRQVPLGSVRYFTRDDASSPQAATYVCVDCFTLADSYYRRRRSELEGVLLLLREHIRSLLERGMFHPVAETQGSEVSKAELLRAVVQLQEVHHAPAGRPGTRDPSVDPYLALAAGDDTSSPRNPSG